MAVSLYGQSTGSEWFDILCLKLLGCLVAILQQTHGVVNVDSFLSVTDIACLMHDGGVILPTIGHHYIFDRSNVEAKLKRLVTNDKVIPIVSVPRSFQTLSSKLSWWTYYVMYQMKVADNLSHSVGSMKSRRGLACQSLSPEQSRNSGLPVRTELNFKHDYVRVLADTIKCQRHELSHRPRH